MIRADLKRSEEYWIGELPREWEELFARRVFSQIRLPRKESDEQLTASQKYGVIPQKLFMEKQGHKVALATKGTDGFKHVDKNDFVISLRSFQGGIEICHYAGCVSPAYVILRLNKGEHSYFQYLLKCDAFIARFQSLTDGLRDGKMISYDQLGGVKLPFPTRAEQRQIAAYLNRETAKIDKLIAKQQKLIKLLAEKRQAVISNAVTKGLDPNVKMKDSGVEWLGEVPEHWSTSKVKWNFETTSGGTPKSDNLTEFYDGDIPWLRTLDLNNGFLENAEVYITEEALRSTACKLLPADTLLIAMYGGAGTIGKNARLGFTSSCNQAICAILPSKKVSAKYMHFYTIFYRPFWMVDAVGSRKDPNINQDQVRNLAFPLPPLSEQEEIVQFVENENRKLDALSDRATSAIDLLREHRQALITAAVTGKIDVLGLVTDEEVAALDAEHDNQETDENLDDEADEVSYTEGDEEEAL